MNKLAIMQPYIFPYIGYWQLINAVNTFVILDDVNFIKKGWINRNRILLNGKLHLFTIPLKKASQNKLIKEIELAAGGKTKQEFLKTINLAYNKAPYFKNVFPLIEEIILNKETSLSEYVFYSLKKITQYIGINTNFILSSEIEKDNNFKGQDKIIDICKKLEAKEYINLPGGVELYDKKIFETQGVELKFIKTGYIEYQQFNNDFISNLSVIDIMMFKSKKQLIEIVNNFCLE